MFDLTKLIEERHGDGSRLHAQYLNPKLAQVLKVIGLDRTYVRAQGCYLYDDQGHQYLDFLAGFGVYALGRSHPVVKQALHDALDADFANLVQMDCALLPGLLAEQLVRRAHTGIGRVFFCNSGSEAVEAAIKFARRATRRSRIVYCQHAFHGLTAGALAINGGPEFRQGFGPFLPDCDPVELGSLSALEAALRGGDVAAFVFEPIQGKGVYVASPEYWQSAQELCRRYGTLVVADEVQTGLGRTGRFFCHDHWGLQPDIITVSKALSGGYMPVGAMLCTEKVFQRTYSSLDRAMAHSSTFGGNALAMVAGLATLQVFDDEDIVDRARRTGDLFDKALTPLIDRYELLSEVRGEGLMIGLEFAEPTSRSLRLRWRALEQIHTGLFSQLVVVPLFQRHRILTQVAADNLNVIKLLPPLIAGEEEVNRFVGALEDVLDDAHHGRGFYVGFGRRMVSGMLRHDGA